MKMRPFTEMEEQPSLELEKVEEYFHRQYLQIVNGDAIHLGNPQRSAVAVQRAALSRIPRLPDVPNGFWKAGREEIYMPQGSGVEIRQRRFQTG